MSKSPDVQKRKPLVTYPISPKSKVKSVSQKSVVDMPTINFEESNTQLDAEKVSKKVEKYIDESSVSKCSTKKSKTVRDQKRHHITRRAIKKQVFILFVVQLEILYAFFSSNQGDLIDFRTRRQS